MPMDIEFVVQDAFAIVRPSWKLYTSLEEAGNAFAQACRDNHNISNIDKATEPEEIEELDDEIERRSIDLADEDKSSSDEGEVGQFVKVDHSEINN